MQIDTYINNDIGGHHYLFNIHSIKNKTIESIMYKILVNIYPSNFILEP